MAQEEFITLKHSVARKVRLKVSDPKRARQAMGKVKLSTTNWMASAWVTNQVFMILPKETFYHFEIADKITRLVQIIEYVSAFIGFCF